MEEIIHTHLYSILSLIYHQMASPCTSTIHDHDQRSATLHVTIWVQCERFHKMWSWYVVLYGYSHDLVATHWLVWVRPSSARNLLLCWTTPRRAWVKFGPGPGPDKKIWLVLLDRARHDRRFFLDLRPQPCLYWKQKSLLGTPAYNIQFRKINAETIKQRQHRR